MRASLRDLVRLASGHPSTGFHIYTDDDDQVDIALPNITLSGLGGDDFLQDMAGCRAVICTAGFETVCESAFLGKPVMIIPSRNHFEQLCNAVDARRAGLAFKLTDSWMIRCHFSNRIIIHFIILNSGVRSREIFQDL